MDRRRFLGLTIGSLVVAGCGGGGSGGNSGGGAVASSSSSVAASPELQALASQMTGKLIKPSDADYTSARLVFNTRFDSILPQAVARCANEADVIAVLAHAQKYNVPITPRSGGHGYAGYSTTTGIVIDVSPMNSITLGTGTATIGAGAKLVDVYDQLTAKGVAIPTGSCTSVGIAGITQGGGIGIVDRAYGLTCDNLLSVDIVTADGKKITCSDALEPDLFWALRGGGGGNFGVVTSFTFKTHPTSDITTLEAYFDFNDLEKVMAIWQTLPVTLPDNIWAQAIISWMDSNPIIQIRGFCVGSQADAAPHWNKFLADVQSTPVSPATSTTASYRQTMLGNCGNAPAACRTGQRNGFAASSDFFDTVVPVEGIRALKKFIFDGRATNRGMIILDLMGGAIDNFQPTDTAFIHRNAIFSAEYYTYFIGATTAVIDDAQVWEHSFRTLMKPWSSGLAYVNYIDPLITDWKTAYYGENYVRLSQVKAKYDPNWLFKMPQGIQPA